MNNYAGDRSINSVTQGSKFYSDNKTYNKRATFDRVETESRAGSHVTSHDCRIVARVWSRLKPRAHRIGDVLSSCLATGNRRRVDRIIYLAD